MPMGKYKNFDNCVSSVMSDKGWDKERASAYCATIKKKIEGESMSKKNWKVLEYCVPITEAVKINNRFLIKGIAINETVTRNGVKYQAEELEKSVSTLRDKPILEDHENKVRKIVGRTTQNVNFNATQKNILFEGQIMDSQIQEMINDGRIKAVSIGATVKELEEQESDEGKNLIAKGIDFVELSLVAVPADPNAGFARAIWESYDLKKQMENEIMVQESLKIKEKMHCPECDAEMEDKEELKKHMKAKHKDMEEEKMAESNNIAQEFEARIKERELSLTNVSEKLKQAESRLRMIEEEKLNSLRQEYKSLASELKLNAKDVSNTNEESLKILIESLKEIKASKSIEVKEVPKAETKGTVISEGKDDNSLSFMNEYVLTTEDTLRGFALTRTQESLDKFKSFNHKVSPFDRYANVVVIK